MSISPAYHSQTAPPTVQSSIVSVIEAFVGVVGRQLRLNASRKMRTLAFGGLVFPSFTDYGLTHA